MESLICHKYESCSGTIEFSGEVLSFLNNIKHDIGSRVLLVGKVGELGKRIRAFGVQVTILEHSRRDEICFSHIMNENCTVVSGQLEYMPFNDNYFDKIIVLDYLNHTANCKKSVKEINRVLKYGGEVIVEDLNLKDLRVSNIESVEIKSIIIILDKFKIYLKNMILKENYRKSKIKDIFI